MPFEELNIWSSANTRKKPQELEMLFF